jgi:hypothetical protein
MLRARVVVPVPALGLALQQTLSAIHRRESTAHPWLSAIDDLRRTGPAKPLLVALTRAADPADITARLNHRAEQGATLPNRAPIIGTDGKG